jgi:AcrR family transcriptional regulator
VASSALNTPALDTSVLGLRDRKRVETRRRLECAAVELVGANGLEHATVDAISERADVSPRTFFNYFESKEDAIVGLHDRELTREDVLEYINRNDGAPLIDSIVGLLFEVMGASVNDTELRNTRMEILNKYPQLLGRQIVQMTRMGEKLVRAIDTIIERDPKVAVTSLSPGVAQVTLSMCGAAVRAAVTEWAAAGRAAAINNVQQRAIELVREATETLT